MLPDHREHVAGVRRRDGEARRGPTGVVDEAADRRPVAREVEDLRRVRWDGEGAQPHDRLAVDAERRVTGDDELQPRVAVDQVGEQAARRIDLERIDEHDDRLGALVVDQPPQAERGDRFEPFGVLGGVGDEHVGRIGDDVSGEVGLADARGSDDRHETGSVGDRQPQCVEFDLPPPQR